MLYALYSMFYFKYCYNSDKTDHLFLNDIQQITTYPKI